MEKRVEKEKWMFGNWEKIFTHKEMAYVFMRTSTWGPLGCFPIKGCDRRKDVFGDKGHVKESASSDHLSLQLNILTGHDIKS